MRLDDAIKGFFILRLCLGIQNSYADVKYWFSLQGRFIDTTYEGDNFFSIRGNPFWNIEIIGEKAAGALGIFQIGSDMVTMPDAAEATHRVKTSNLFKGGFYQPKKKFVPKKKYVSRYVYYDILPLAGSGGEAPHDAHFHFLTKHLLPEEFTDLFRAQRRILLEFRKFLKKKHLAYSAILLALI